MFYGEGNIVNVSRLSGKRPFIRVEFENFMEKVDDKLVSKPYKNFLMFFDDEVGQKKMRDLIEEMSGVIAINFRTSEYMRGGEAVTSKIIDSFTDKIKLEELIDSKLVADVHEERLDESKDDNMGEKILDDMDKKFDKHLLDCLIESEKTVADFEVARDLNIKHSSDYWILVASVFERRATPKYYFFNGYR